MLNIRPRVPPTHRAAARQRRGGAGRWGPRPAAHRGGSDPMNRRRLTQASAAAALALALALPAAAQQTPAPPSWAQGRTDAQAGSPLAPHAPALTAKQAKDIPINKLKLPPGFEATIWATGLTNARSMTVGPKGTVFVGTRL